MTGTDTADGATTGPLSWDDVCERFHDIRVRAHAHALQDDWRALVTGPGTPTAALLSRWQDLVDEIERLDAGRDDSTIRYGDDDGTADAGGEAGTDGEPDSVWLDDEWESESEEFGCPDDRCRRVRTTLLLTPRCWLLNLDMRQLPRTTEPAPDGTR
ncbi:hypothetical protein ACFV23_22675 [Streptomyces sp. NPDC059627]